MDVLTAIKSRRSIRKYLQTPVEDEKINLVLEAARLSPSASNRQNWKFIIVKDAETRARLCEAADGQKFVEQAPVTIVACAEEPTGVMKCGQSRHTVDLSIATAYMILEAHDLGLGTCWLGLFDEEKVKQILGIPQDKRVVAITPLGYPAEAPSQRSRKQLDEIACYERYK